MTLTEPKHHSLGVGDEVKTFDNLKDGEPKKWTNGKVTEIGDESFAVQWEDLRDETEYEWQNVCIRGDEIIDAAYRTGSRSE